jgi:hypothetical protein
MRNTYPCGDIKGGGSQEGFYFIFGKLERQRDDLGQHVLAMDRSLCGKKPGMAEDGRPCPGKHGP